MATYVYIPGSRSKKAMCQVKPNCEGKEEIIPWAVASLRIQAGDILVKDGHVRQKGSNGEFHDVKATSSDVSLSPTHRSGGRRPRPRRH